MHDIQKKILELAKQRNIAEMTLRQIGELISNSQEYIHPQRIRHHIGQLVKKGLLTINEIKKKARVEMAGEQLGSLVSVPIVGAANCGEATILAEENIEGFLRVSSSLIKGKTSGICAIHAVGDSMNLAEIGSGIGTRNIEDGDYVIVDYENKSPDNNDYVLSVIDGAANIKKFIKDEDNQQVILKSESTQNYPPIFIHIDDSENYFVNGVVVQVIKLPKKM